MKIEILNAGFCTHLEKIIIKGGKLKSIHFPALFTLIEHPNLGYILFDTGYSSHVLEGMKHFPYNIYGLITPVYLFANESAKEQLEAMNLSPKDISYIILSHFHADHIGGVRDFPESKFICSKLDYNLLKGKTGFSALKDGFIPSLLPADFEQRVSYIEDRDIAQIPIPNNEFNWGYDIFRDGSIFAIKLEGHSRGQFGILLKSEQEWFFFVSDACWLTETYKYNALPSKIASVIIQDNQKYKENIFKIHTLNIQHPEIRIVPSHCTHNFKK